MAYDIVTLLKDSNGHNSPRDDQAVMETASGSRPLPSWLNQALLTDRLLSAD